MSKSHGGYTEEQSRGAGLTGSSEHLKSMAGYSSIADARAAAPTTEESTEGGKNSKRTPGPRPQRMTADEAKTAMLRTMFEQNKPIHLRRWERKIRMLHRLHEMIGATPISEKEIQEGAELHYELCVVMEWFTYSKYEIIIDISFWWVRTIVEHDPHAQQFLAAWNAEQQNPEVIEIRNTEARDGIEN